jgi:hypothetical protein
MYKESVNNKGKFNIHAELEIIIKALQQFSDLLLNSKVGDRNSNIPVWNRLHS